MNEKNTHSVQGGKKRESTCVFLGLAASLNSDAAAVRPDVILSH